MPHTLFTSTSTHRHRLTTLLPALFSVLLSILLGGCLSPAQPASHVQENHVQENHVPENHVPKNHAPRPAQPAEQGWRNAQAIRCELDRRRLLDRFFPDYVACFLIPAQATWQLYPLTQRAYRATHTARGKLHLPQHEQVSAAGRELCFASGWLNNNRAGYGHRNPWEFGNELLVRYRPNDPAETPAP